MKLEVAPKHQYLATTLHNVTTQKATIYLYFYSLINVIIYLFIYLFTYLFIYLLIYLCCRNGTLNSSDYVPIVSKNLMVLINAPWNTKNETMGRGK
jgi:hypothetical protein